MGEFENLRSALKHLLLSQLAPMPRFTRGRLGNGLGKIRVPDREDFSFVRPSRSSEETVEVFNKEVSGGDGTPVLIGELPWQPGLTQVVGVDWETYIGAGWGSGYAGIAQHGATHIWRDGFVGTDTFNIFRRQIAPLRTYPAGSGSMSVYVFPYDYWFDGTPISWTGLPALDLSAARPATGTARLMLTYLDTESNVVSVVTGSIDVHSDAVELARPALPTGSWLPSGYVRVYGGQGTVNERDIWDARQMWASPTARPGGPSGGDLTGTYPNPNVVGIYGEPIDESVPPVEGDVLVYSATGTNYWRPADHGYLGGLDDDDHTQYLLADGTRELTGAWNTGDFLVTFGAGIAFDGATGENSITVPDNLAQALHIVDDGDANDYFTIDSRNAQRRVVFNQGGVDVDTVFGAVGAPNALFIRGSDGRVSVGRASPPTLFDVYHATDSVQFTLETDKVNGVASAIFRNDAQAWNFGLNASDQFIIRDLTNTITPLFINTASLNNSLHLKSTEIAANDDGLDLNLRWESLNEDKLLLGDASLDQLRLGDGDTNYFVTNNLGDTWWVGGGGLVFGDMYVPGVDIEVTITGTAPHEVKDGSGDGWAAGALNLVTFPTGGDEHYLTVPLAGRYEVNWSMSLHTDTGGASVIHGGIMVDDMAQRNDGEDHTHVSNSNDDQSISSQCVVDCPNGTEEISLWAADDNGRDLHIEHSTMTIKLVGGT